MLQLLWDTFNRVRHCALDGGQTETKLYCVGAENTSRSVKTRRKRVADGRTTRRLTI
jgi:hypothetical protein